MKAESGQNKASLFFSFFLGVARSNLFSFLIANNLYNG